MRDCLFCGIAIGEIPADIVWESGDVVVFKDVNPQAPVHLLSIPRVHFADVAAVVEVDPMILSAMLEAVITVANDQDLDEGYRIVFNKGSMGGQTVPHVHAHLLGGRQMGWPPG